jgi:hypothetical protein
MVAAWRTCRCEFRRTRTVKSCTDGRAARPKKLNGPEYVRPVRVIVDVLEQPGQTTLVVSAPGEANQTVQVAASPAEGAVEIPIHARPLAVRFNLSERPPRCSCLVSTPEGPRRIEISVAGGLSLVATGVHGILAAGPAIRRPRGGLWVA